MDGRMETRRKLDICGIFMGINYYIGVLNIFGLLYILLTTTSQLNTFQLVGDPGTWTYGDYGRIFVDILIASYVYFILVTQILIWALGSCSMLFMLNNVLDEMR